MRLLPVTVLSVAVLAACSSAPIAGDPPPMTPMPPPVDFSDTGEIPCSAGAPTLDQFCIFGITRGAGGSAALHVLNPTSDVAGIQRVLLYQSGAWTTVTGSAVGTERRGDATLLSVNETEFYAVPDAVLTGR